MKVLVVGATGALGVPVVRALARAGHDVFGTTRSPDKASLISAAGGKPVLAEVFDPSSLERCFAEAQPEGVFQCLNALPKRGPFKPEHLEGTNRLRTEGTRNVLAAALAAGARRFVVESMIFGYGYAHGDRMVTEDVPFMRNAPEQVKPALDALISMEEQLQKANDEGSIESVILRYGLFYGPEAGSTQNMVKMLRRRIMPLPEGTGVGSWIHLDDGADVAVLALEKAPAGSVYNVVDDEPMSLSDHASALAGAIGVPGPRRIPPWMMRLGGSYLYRVSTSTLRVSNEKIKRELGWSPRYPSVREGAATLRGPGSTAA